MKEEKPFALRFLRSFCPPYLREEIEGDLLQRFERDVKVFGRPGAIRRLTWNTLRFFRLGILLRNKFSTMFFNNFMLTNYLKVAIRVMVRNKAFTAINVFGLTLGISGALLLFTWIQKEFTYDQFHADSDRLFKMWNRANNNEKISCWDVTPMILAPTLQEKFTSVESAISYAEWGDQFLFTVGEKRIMKSSGVYTQPTFLTMFSFPMLKGDPKKALQDPASIVISEKFASELFDGKEAFGELLTILASGQRFTFTVTGVIKDLPGNTSFNFDYIIPLAFLEGLWGGREENWANNSVGTFVKLKAGVDVADFNNQIKDLVRSNHKNGKHMEVFAYPLTNMRLYARFENGLPAGGRIEIVRLLGILGVSLIVMACINFINLSTARAQRRTKEVAVRKVTGAARRTLAIQFLFETILIVFVATIFSIGIAWLALPLFNNLVSQQLRLELFNPIFWMVAIAFVLITGVLAGSYPAFYLAAFKPIGILKGLKLSSKSIGRTALVVVQFGFAVMLVVSAVVVHRQILFVQHRDAGYNKDNLIYQYLTGDLGKNYEAYKNELIQTGVAESVTKTSSAITQRWSNTSGIGWRDKDPENKTLFERFYVDTDFSKTAGLTVLAGRDMDLTKFPSDSSSVILNEAAAHAMGFRDPLGEIITDGQREWKVIGVIKDFILTSPFQKVEPILIFGCKDGWAFNAVHIKLNTKNAATDNLDKLTQLSRKYNPEFPVEYQFVDQEYKSKFANLEATRKITMVFTLIALVIAGLGLLGLSTYMIETRVKEIGIRRVMGGSVLRITSLLSFTSIKPILISILLFSPAAWYAMRWWLNSYAYRVELSIWIFLTAAISIIFLALVVIGGQTIHAAKANPVDSLRNE